MIQRRLTKRGEVRWDVRIKRPDRTEYSRTFRTKKEAERYEATELAAKARGTWVDPSAGRITFATWADDWQRSNSHSWRSTTAEKHAVALRSHWVPKFGPLQLNTITPLQVQAAVTELAGKRKPATVRTYYGTLRSLFGAAVDLDVIGRSPCRAIKLPRASDGEKRVISPDELHQLAGHIDGAYRPVIYLAGVMGLRFGEAIGLRLCDIDTEQSRIAIRQTVTEVGGRVSIGRPKTRSSIRTLAAPTRLMALLVQHIEDHDVSGPQALLFTDSGGGPIRRTNFRVRFFDPAVAAAGLHGLTFHGLRHSAATQWVADGIDSRTAQQRLGHSDPRLILKLYAHASTPADERAAEVSDRSYWPKLQEPDS